MTQPQPMTPTAETLSNAKSAALDARKDANLRLGRVVAVAVAAAWRDLQPDATQVEMGKTIGDSMWCTGRYWTTEGQERAVDQAEMYEMREWVEWLDDDTQDAWQHLTTKLPDDPGTYWKSFRFDLIKSAALPIG